ncbi:MAG: hypothetical protein QXP07_03215 [Candidatus Parvarchaeum sp.]|nr:hypothetical protein [Candidatus Parvarchaeum tengchongense]
MKLKDSDQDRDYILRIVELPGIIQGNYKISRYPGILDELKIPLQEVLVDENLTDILNAYNDKQIEDQLTHRLRKKIIGKGNRKIVLFLNLKVDNPSLITNPSNLSNVARVINDIYYSNPSVDLVSAPNLICKDVLQQGINLYQIYMHLLEQIASDTEKKLVYFLPSYLSISQKESLIEWYRNKYGDDGLFAIDCSGERFSSECYKGVAVVYRKMRQIKIQDYGVYLFDIKPHKRTSKSSPSEELLSILHGANLVGPLHSNTPVPPHVVEKIHQQNQSYVKVFNEDTYLYEPKMWTDYAQAQIESDRKINEVLQKEILPKNVGSVLSQGIKTNFLDELRNTKKNYDKISQNSSLTSFFNTSP